MIVRISMNMYLIKANLLLATLLISISSHSQTTQLQAAFCPTTVASMGTNIRCDGAAGAEGYRFEIWDEAESDSLTTYDSFANNRGNRVRFSWIGGGVIEYSTTYSIRVSWYDLDTDTWSAPGTFCKVTSPVNPFTQISSSFCSTEIATESTNIFCDQIAGAIEYRFEVSVGGTVLELVDKTTYKLRLSDFTSPGHPQHCTQYDLRVAYKTSPGGPWSSFGTSCFVTFKIPTTIISPVYCGTTINYLQQDTIHANANGVADAYRFRIETGGTIIEDTVVNPGSYNGITFRKFPGVQYGQTYNVSVKILSNGCWGDYGSSCAISTVAQPVTKLRPAYCGITMPSPGSNVYGNSIIYAQEYEYRINGGVLSNEIYNTTTGNNGVPTSPRFRMTWLDNAALVSYGTVYSIEARVKVGGAYGAWGDVCNITLSGSPVTELKPVFCGVTLASMGVNMYCNTVSLSQGYKFEVRTTGEVLIGEYDGMAVGTSSKFRITWVPGIANSVTYRVRAAWHNGTTWSGYGSFCEVTTPASGMVINGGDDTIDWESDALKNIGGEFDLDLVSYPNPFLDEYHLSLTSNMPLSDEELILWVTDMQGRRVEFQKLHVTNLSSLSFGRDYSPGTYLLNIKFSDRVIQKRIVKTR